jgi:aspartyl/glutamyl-tRNA(Asn/Gln) amidotransferase C subunit
MNTTIKFALIALATLLLASCKGKKQPTETPAPSISVATPEVKDITLTKDYPGYLSSELMVNLVARVNGYLQTSHLKAGSKVRKGDLIFVIEPDTYKDNVTQAEAALKTAQAQLDYARSNYERMKEAAKSDMEQMLDYIDTLNELDTTGIEPMSHVFPVQNVFREDVVTNGDNKEKTLANAPLRKEDSFEVPKTIG